MGKIKFCEKCRGLISFKKKDGVPKPFCQRCGFLEIEIDPSGYKSRSIDVGIKHETVIIDRAKELQKMKEQFGARTSGPSCPNCGSFYLTKHLMVTRGDEAGKTFRLCLQCGLSFRRPIWVQRTGKDKIFESNDKNNS